MKNCSVAVCQQVLTSSTTPRLRSAEADLRRGKARLGSPKQDAQATLGLASAPAQTKTTVLGQRAARGRQFALRRVAGGIPLLKYRSIRSFSAGGPPTKHAPFYYVGMIE
ncbi:MAG: hypothetical protein A2945_04600 [Candidatus Liptonbacteria bacterium RIFCSPLOWO2_01_FULL_52_25]|uniref:Uncharacterized protein n=1 Tax=Candidatus Liptonbacteria bacterium RIFCSPLOWO2_01_FULL_52_25 TaxID=1798650 RepID=A0A1G2CIN8_9BACT|nr:MAG: hypothetical protein A2945_04600 [Candidatus Liptonbacteria bacterium RIFCSPLOWO2_01_FULL_52_25]